MKRLTPIILCALPLWTAGCLSDLDTKWHEVNERFRDGNRAYAAVSRGYADAAAAMATKKHVLQRIHLERDWEDFIRIHSQDGRLVSRDAAGQIVPLSVEDLQAAIAARDQKLLDLRESQASWQALHDPFLIASTRFEEMTESTGRTEAEIIEAKSKAQMFVEDALKVIGGIAAGAGTAAVVAP